MKFFHSKYLPVVAFVVMFGTIYFVGQTIPEQSIRLFVKNTGPLAPLLLLLLMLLTYIIAPLSNVPFMFAGFYLYGKNIVFLASLAAFIASIINFWIARAWGRLLVEKLAGKSSMNKIDKLTASYGLPLLFISRVFLGGEHDIVSYAMGLTSMKFYPYLLISTLGSIPATIVWYIIASQTNNPLTFTSFTLIQVYILTVLFIIGAILYGRFKK